MYTKCIVQGTVESEKGFYIGDVCYVLTDDVYHEFWGCKKKFADGIFEVPGMCGIKFAVGGTAEGDGCYADQLGHSFPVDAGVIGLVPIELVKNMNKAMDLGLVVNTPGIAEFKSDDGIFSIVLPDGQTIEIDTHFNEGEYQADFYDDDDYDEDDDYYDDEEDEDEDDDF